MGKLYLLEQFHYYVNDSLGVFTSLHEALEELRKQKSNSNCFIIEYDDANYLKTTPLTIYSYIDKYIVKYCSSYKNSPLIVEFNGPKSSLLKYYLTSNKITYMDTRPSNGKYITLNNNLFNFLVFDDMGIFDPPSFTWDKPVTFHSQPLDKLLLKYKNLFFMPCVPTDVRREILGKLFLLLDNPHM